MTVFVLAWVLTYLVHSTIAICGAWLLERRWGDRPERMSAVWKAALVGGVLTASIQLGLGIAPIAGQWSLNSEIVPSDPVSAAGMDALPVPAVDSDFSPRTTIAIAEAPVHEPAVAHALIAVDPVPAPVVVAVDPSVAAPAALSASPTSGSSVAAAIPWIVGVLALGSMLGLLSVMVSWIALRRALVGRAPIRTGALRSTLDRLLGRAQVERHVQLDEAPRVEVPMAVGVVRGQIVLPPQIVAKLSEEHQEGLLAHELAHVVRRDPAWRLIAACIERVLFFQPLNRLASRHLSQTAEYACDDWAARHTDQPLALASCLAEIATWVGTPRGLAATMAGPRSILGRRVHRLLDPCARDRRPRWLLAALALPLLALVVIVPGAAAHGPTTAQAEPSADTESIAVVPSDELGRRVAAVSEPIEARSVWVGHDGEISEVPAMPPRVRKAIERRAGRDTRRAVRRQLREVEREQRAAKAELRRAVREAMRNGEAIPNAREVTEMLRRAEAEAHAAQVRAAEVRATHGRRGIAVVPDRVEIHADMPVYIEDIGELEELDEFELERLLLEQALESQDGRHIDVVIHGGPESTRRGIEVEVHEDGGCDKGRRQAPARDPFVESVAPSAPTVHARARRTYVSPFAEGPSTVPPPPAPPRLPAVIPAPPAPAKDPFRRARHRRRGPAPAALKSPFREPADATAAPVPPKSPFRKRSDATVAPVPPKSPFRERSGGAVAPVPPKSPFHRAHPTPVAPMPPKAPRVAPEPVAPMVPPPPPADELAPTPPTPAEPVVWVSWPPPDAK